MELAPSSVRRAYPWRYGRGYPPFPVFFLVDYINHKVKQQSEAEYAECLLDMEG